MSVLSSPSPTLSPNHPAATAFARERRQSYASSLRRTGSHRSSYRLSPSSSTQQIHSHASSPATSVHSSTANLQLTPTSAPKRRAHDNDDDSYSTAGRAATVDVGTQYTPPDFPPTAKRSMTSTTSTVSQAVPETSASLGDHEEVLQELETVATSTPQEPSLRQDPTPHTPTETSSESGAVSSVSETTSLLDSPTKRIRGDKPVKIMPLDYMKCDVRDLGIVIADMLLELIRINDPLPHLENKYLTRYHSRYVASQCVGNYQKSNICVGPCPRSRCTTT